MRRATTTLPSASRSEYRRIWPPSDVATNEGLARIARRRRLSPNSGCGAPPKAETRIGGPMGGTYAMDWPSAVQAALASGSPDSSTSSVTASPRSATLPIPSLDANPIELLSGDQKTCRAPVTPSTSIGSCRSRDCSHIDPREPVVVNAM